MMLVIDVSEWQGRTPLQGAHDNGYAGVIARAGYSGKKDDTFDWYKDQAARLGMLFGAYFYAYPGNDAVADARSFVSWCSPIPEGMTFWLDVEESALTDSYVDAFLATVDALTGQSCGIYASTSYVRERPWMQANVGGRVWWQANYPGGSDVPSGPFPRVGDLTSVGWQFTDSRFVPGFARGIDCSIFTSWNKSSGEEDADMARTDEQLKAIVADAVANGIHWGDKTYAAYFVETLNNTRELVAQNTALTAAVQSLAGANGLDATAVQATIDQAVRDAMSRLAVTVAPKTV